MKFELIDNFLDNEKELMRKCGYYPHLDYQTKKINYLKRLTNLNYPRFHLYLKKSGKLLIFNLHLDQKKPSYYGFKAHSGEKDGSVIEDEVRRIINILTKFK